MFCSFVLSKLTYQVYYEKQKQSDGGGYMTAFVETQRLLDCSEFYCMQILKMKI